MTAGTPDRGVFGQRLWDLRRKVGLSQEELSHAAGVSVRALADLERGRTRGPHRRTVQALADGLMLDAAAAEALEQAACLGRPRPRQSTPPAHSTMALPRDIRDFTARVPALEDLLVLVQHADPAQPPVSVVSGQPGLGKTAFAVHAAHRLAPHFPDGQLALDLRGTDPEPTTPRDALGRLLRAMGVADWAVPAGTDDRVGLFRSVTGDRRLLLLLDNAADETQVRPLLPATGPSLTLVTSRHALAGLEAVHRTHLEPLRREESVEMLTRIVGAERVRREAQAARDLANLCGHLPLAVRIAGQRLAARPGERLGKLVTQLAAEGRRLDVLQAGGLRVRAAFTLSYERLPPATKQLFRRAALAAGPNFSPESAGVLAGLSIAQAAEYAEELVDAGLLQPEPAAERYRFHDLLKLFAAERLAAEDDTETYEAAQDRAAQWMLRRATTAALYFDAECRQDPPTGDPDPEDSPGDRTQARAWLEAERDQWLAALRRAGATGHHQQVIDTAEAMHWFSDLNQHWEQWAEVFRHAVDAARALGSRPDEAIQLNYLAWAYNLCVHDYPAALAAADAALEVARGIGDGLQTGWALGHGAAALHRMGRTDESLDRFGEAASCLRAAASPEARLAELTILNAFGNNLRQCGRAEEALGIHLRSEAVCRAGIPGQRRDLIASYRASAQQQMGNDLAALGRLDEAEGLLRQALAQFEAAGMAAWSAPARLELGIVLRKLARHEEARRALLVARDALAELNAPRHGEAVAELRALDEVVTVRMPENLVRPDATRLAR
ncbi:helix-turn-helix transcriptional regulator [Actinoplanes sp. NPDC049118]|uniref:ATP-binding protein n=1 Tax=Actinoplanes sp. NPDC049118 TaxID=3155769 RepID=UPI0033D6EA7A